MSATAKKTGKGGKALQYYVLGTELGMSGKIGLWHDPQDIFARFGITEGQQIGRDNPAPLLCLARGLNPTTASSAFNKHGSFDPAAFAGTIWTAASDIERRKIARLYKQVGITGLHAKSTAGQVSRAVGNAFNRFHADQFAADLWTDADAQLKADLAFALKQQGVFIYAATSSAEEVARSIVDHPGFDTPAFARELWRLTDDRAALTRTLKTAGIDGITSASSAKKIGEQVKISASRFDVDADNKAAAHQKLEGKIFQSARMVKGTEFTLTPNAGMQRSTGYDWTFEVPKDLSLLYAMCNPETRKRIEQIVISASKAGIAYFNAYAARTRVKQNGVIRDIGARFAAAQFLDFTARPVSLAGDPHPALREYLEANRQLGGREGVFVDPHLHVHSVIPNIALCDDGSWRAIDTKNFMVAHQAAQEAAHSRLAALVQSELGLSIKREDGRMAFSIPEIAREHVEVMSKRRGSMLDKMAADGLGNKFADISRELESKIHHETREAHITVSNEDLDAHWLTQGKLMGFGRDEVEALLAAARAQNALQGRRPDPSLMDIALIREEIFSIAKSMHEARGLSAFSADMFRAEVLKQFTGRHDVNFVLEHTDAIIHERLAGLGRFDARNMLATHDWIAMETATVDLAVFGRHENRVQPEITEAAIQRMNERLGKDGHAMSAEQKDAVRYLLDTDNLVTVLEGPAGAGKTTILLPTVEALVESGYTDIKGLALSWSASGTLQSEAKLNSAAAIEKLAFDLKKGKVKFTDRTAVIVDEGSLVGSLHYNIILTAAAEAGARVVITGHAKQINAVAAGSMMDEIVEHKRLIDGVGSFRLSEIRRQKSKADSTAALGIVEAEALTNPQYAADVDKDILVRIQAEIDAAKAAGKDTAAMEKLIGAKYALEFDKKHGRFHLEGTRDQAIEAALEKYVELRQTHGESMLIVALKNESVDALNTGVRDYLKSIDAIGKDDVQVQVKIGDNERTIGFSEGDYIQFRKKAEGKAQPSPDGTEDQVELGGHVYNRTRAKLLKIEGKGKDVTFVAQIYAGDKLTDRVVRIGAKDFRDGKMQAEHAFAVTVNSSQGMTVNATIEVDEGQGQQRKYVGRTRHRHECHTYANMDDLHRQAAKLMDADNFTNRNTFSRAQAEEVLVAQWSRKERKVTTLDFIADRNIKAGLSCLHGSRFATEARIADAILKTRTTIDRTARAAKQFRQGAAYRTATAYARLQPARSQTAELVTHTPSPACKPSDVESAFAAVKAKPGAMERLRAMVLKTISSMVSAVKEGFSNVTSTFGEDEMMAAADYITPRRQGGPRKR